MAANAYQWEQSGDLPLDLQMDLLVDAELPEEWRSALLRQMDEQSGAASQDGATWRALAMRFLQRQVEKQTVRELIDDGVASPAAQWMPPDARKTTMLFRRWRRSSSLRSVAAGVLIAAGSVTVTMYAMRASGAKPEHQAGQVALTDMNSMYRGSVPAEALGGGGGGGGIDGSLAVDVPVTAHRGGVGDWLPVNEEPSSRRSVIIEKYGNDNAVVIPVSTVSLKFY